MTRLYITPLRRSGTHVWCHAESDDPRILEAVAQELRKSVQSDRRGLHVDLSPKEREYVLRAIRGVEIVVDVHYNPPTLNN